MGYILKEPFFWVGCLVVFAIVFMAGLVIQRDMNWKCPDDTVMVRAQNGTVCVDRAVIHPRVPR
jgi:hypothetical protein